MVCGVGHVGASSGPAEALEPFFQVVFDSDFFRFLMDLRRILGGQMDPKIDFWEVFLNVFFDRNFGIDFL